MRPLALGIALGLPGLFAFACSSSKPSAIESFAADYCSYFTPCCSSGDAGVQNPSGCQDTVTSWQSFGFDPSLTSACLAAMKQNAGTADFCTTLGAADAPCAAVFSAVPSSGSVPPGGTCNGPGQCATVSGSVAVCLPVDLTQNPSTGTCRQVLRGFAGDSPCSSDSYDNTTSTESPGPLPNLSYTCHDFDGVCCNFTTNKCEPFLATGAECSPSGDPCGPTAFCGAAGEAADGGALFTCTPGLAAGVPCNPAAPLNDGCDPTTTRCLVATNTCEPFLPTGSACTTGDPCQGACVNGKCATELEDQLCDRTVGVPFDPRSMPVRPFARVFSQARR